MKGIDFKDFFGGLDKDILEYISFCDTIFDDTIFDDIVLADYFFKPLANFHNLKHLDIRRNKIFQRSHIDFQKPQLLASIVWTLKS